MKTRLKRALVLMLGLVTGLSALAQSDRVFDVRGAGAKGDGKTDDTVAIQTALDACGKAGGGTVQLLKGRYYSKPLTIRTRTTLQIGRASCRERV